MLVLTRKIEEGIMIGDDITIKILEIKGDKIKLGIKAPKGLDILRQELHKEVKEENILAIDSFKNIGKLTESLVNKKSAKEGTE